MANASAAQSGIDGLTMACVPLKDYNQAPTERLCALHQTAGEALRRDRLLSREGGKGAPSLKVKTRSCDLRGGQRQYRSDQNSPAPLPKHIKNFNDGVRPIFVPCL